MFVLDGVPCPLVSASCVSLSMANGVGVLVRWRYQGIFTRIMKLQLPIDYYWIWTPEGWEWGKMNEK